MIQTFYISVLAASIVLETQPSPNALASIQLDTYYAFDQNVVATVKVIDNKTIAPVDDPLNNLIFSITLSDKITAATITKIEGRLYTGGGIDALEEKYGTDFLYMAGKLDMVGALNSDYDFFDHVVTSYDPNQASAIKTALDTAGVLSALGAYRQKSVTLSIPATAEVDATPDEVHKRLMSLQQRPNYIAIADMSSLPIIEAAAEVMNKRNCHLMLDVGDFTDWHTVVALVNSIGINDARCTVLWSPNKSRHARAATVLARKKWRPCVGDYLGKHLLRNARTNESGIAPLHEPIAGYRYPIVFKDMEKMAGVDLDEEAQNAIASARVIPVIYEEFSDGGHWIYGDALTQYDSKTSALKLTNAAEIATYTTNVVIGIVKKHLLKAMSSFIEDVQDEAGSFLDKCATAGLLQPSAELDGKYYVLTALPTDNSFEKATVTLIRRPEGCARQVIFSDTVTR